MKSCKIIFELKCDIQNRRFPIQRRLSARPGLGTQSRYETPVEVRVEFVKTQ